jgi:D-glycero-D-manno-heptose 1,7-bisphosphate phosphatase
MSSVAVFLDRDGTINEDPGYLGDPEKVKLYPGTGQALSMLKSILHFKIIVVSNQSGIARGFISEEDVDAVNARINELLKRDNVSIDAFYYCPHHPEFSSKQETECRKPSPLMIYKASKDLNINLEKSYMVGDTSADILCGKNAGLKTILVKTGYGKESISILQNQNIFPSFVAENISDACKFIYEDFTGEIIDN